ncbi:hypothetical protein MKX03_011381 [Papaver bracteatum]|nr:hypothetical protein MKX03_011381 [Papaver bracteatum]
MIHYLEWQDGGKRMGLKFDRIKYWLSVGAQSSDPVQRILFRAGVLPPPPMSAMAHKGGPRNSRPVDPLTGCFVTLVEHTSTDLPKSSKNAELNSKSLNIATLFDK